MSNQKTRHILGISGGKDSAALAIYMRERCSDMEYFFCDTGHELPETYEFLSRLEAHLEAPIARLNADRDFDHWLKMYGGYLPSAKMRWCTRQLKLRPLERWVGEDHAVSYVAIRADEDRTGYLSTKPNIQAVYPFIDAGMVHTDVMQILNDSGVGLPKYYEWRTRSGCYFCFFQRKAEWVQLRDRHPDLYEKAKLYEKTAEEGQPGYTWSEGESLTDLENESRRLAILSKHQEEIKRLATRASGRTLMEVLEDVLEDESGAEPCLICTL